MISKGFIVDTNEILERIKLDLSPASLKTNLKTLNLLINAFLHEIPYENMDFFHKKISSFNILDIYEKIVVNNRGGICYENNTLFAYFLKELGFDVSLIFCELKNSSYISADFPHLALRVQLNKKSYLVDVGFGQNVREALDIDNKSYKTSYEDIEYYLKKNENTFCLYSKFKKKEEKISYCFDLKEVTLKDYESIFDNLKKEEHAVPLFVSKALKDGRVTLNDSVFTINTKDLKRKWQVSSENRNEVLRDYFNIEV